MVRTELRKARLAAGLTQEALANRVGMERTKYNKIERGKLNPDVNEAIRLAKVLKKRVEQIFLAGDVNQVHKAG